MSTSLSVPTQISDRSRREHHEHVTRVPPQVPFVNLFGMRLHPIDLPQAVNVARQLLELPGQHVIVTANVDHVVKISSDATFAAAYRDARLRLVDGAPVALLARIASRKSGFSPSRATGADLMPLLLDLAADSGLRVLFVGGSPSTVQRADERVRSQYGGGLDAAFLCPDPGFDQDPVATRRLQEEIASVDADIVFCCLGAPKQENWWYVYGPQGPKVVLHCGAAIDFWAGTVTRAPSILRRAGFEWLWRLLVEPKRLWRRYVIDDHRFLALVVQELRIRRPDRFGSELIEQQTIELP